MTFDDRISPRAPLPDLDPLKVQYVLLCAQLLAAITQPKAALALAHKLQKHVRVMVQAAQQHFRQRQKAAMLFHPEWREQVIRDLGGWKRLKRWTKRQAAIEAVSAQSRAKAYATLIHPVSDEEEAARRARMREIMTANAHPRILRDPCRMDFDGWFRLPPQPRLTNLIADPDYEYDFDPRPMADFSGVRAPIMIWPAEFKAAAELRPVGVEGEIVAPTLCLSPETSLSPDLIRGPHRKSVRVISFTNFTTLRHGVPRQAREPILVGKPILFFSRAPPNIRGSPNFTLRQMRFGGALSCGL